ncbi:glutamine--fructose-6-phosphate transaminase (isomerizing) [Microbulbifer flavimaris]|uniref:Glutamine--fructose-6-phosphate aminotransferase [isomerizing] n=1 Tax=Microbulbifer flavimaris TaxID=1781068 RepID=A0ABX4I033_9GAMM|nr:MULTISPECIES: glutamine--fructose-6-phosphate transaminase (isomerizing) [Microbulbifer]KUJ83126.1 glutamine--fructose-6-phosphate aminotransferase [Microbulbifer sp. ZGT114]PCO05312.1 glutamine--fructose-6-phosphate transaminase (isomerizing) [Microbulbifer flavimaris]
MCGIVGALAQRNVTEILLEGLRRLEYRGYDSAGVCLLDSDGQLQLRKSEGKVADLEARLAASPAAGRLGIAHTRWATHGAPSDKNSHPHVSGDFALVHNGIIENHQALREELKGLGYQFISETDTEVVVHLIHALADEGRDLQAAVTAATERLDGAYALGVISAREPDVLICARSGSPLVIGVGIEENFIASDPMALRQVTDRFIFLEEGDVAEVTLAGIAVCDKNGQEVSRPVNKLDGGHDAADKGRYRHYMQKEIFEQPAVVAATMAGRIGAETVLPEALGARANEILPEVKQVQIVACGTSYHAGLVARYWLEDWAGIPCSVEVASEIRYRKTAVRPGTLFVTISQSGETADTLAALRQAKELGYLASMTICNVPNSSLVRESELSLMTEAGPEIGVASTKAFTTQLVALQLFCIALAKANGLATEREAELVKALHQLPDLMEAFTGLDRKVQDTSEAFAEKHHALFLGRGVEYPIALEGALKLKEISYIHAEAYPAGELKHGPLALVDADMPVVVVAPNDELLEKLKSNLQEVRARGGELFVFASPQAGFTSEPGITVVEVPDAPESLHPILYTVPLQLLSYHVALLKGTDVDQPRNLAKSVTVE